MKKIGFFLGWLSLMALIGCGRAAYEGRYFGLQLPEDNLVYASYEIADKLIENLDTDLSPDRPILVASFVDVNDIENSSSFGRMMAEYICSRLGKNGYTVVEMKLRDSIYIKEKAGEFLLSRKVKDISAAHEAQAVVVGTYARARRDIYISARLVQADNSKILSSFDVKIRLSENLLYMFES
jgi:TolB-like protein